MRTLLFTLIILGWYSPPQYATGETIKKEMKKKNFFYTCPMHPSVHSDSPGSCPICHMALVKKYTDTNTPTTSLDISQVEGRKNIQVDQNSFSASGAKLYKIENKNSIFIVRAFGKILHSSRFSLQVAEVDLPFITNGLLVKLKSSSANFNEYQGKITSIDSYLEPMGKTIRVEGTILKKHSLRPESTLLASIEIPKNNIISIPEDALLHNSTTDYVFVYDEKKSSLNPIRVQTGLNNNGEVEILNGLVPGMIITRGANFLLDSESRMQFSYDQKNN